MKFFVEAFCFMVTIQLVFCKPGFDPISCDFDEDSSGECIPAELCDEYSGEQLSCGDYDDRKVCCPRRSDGFFDESPSIIDNRFVKYGPFPKPPECGQTVVVQNRITAGRDALPGKFPWMAALWYRRVEKYLCGGSVITTRHVMTAAHCLRKDLDHVRLGDVDLTRDDDDAAPVDIRVEKAIQHEGYHSSTRANDIGLLVLAKEIIFNSFIMPVCLPLTESLEIRSEKSNFVGEDSFVAGWGAIKYGGPLASWLQFAKLKIVSNRNCETAYDNYPVVVNERILCAGDPGARAPWRDSCTGDSGGPLMYIHPSTQHIFQIGIVAFGYQCGNPGFPGLYTRVDKHVKWLTENVVQNLGS